MRMPFSRFASEGIPINIRNTNRPQDKGTLDCGEHLSASRKYAITGIAGKKGFCAINIEKAYDEFRDRFWKEGAAGI